MCKVTVIILSCNHENFIAQAIESALAQQVNFDYKIIVADDGSTDNSLKIINDFVLENPEQIIALNSAKKNGVRQNVFLSKTQINSKYVAILDGDDYWNYKHKLQQQVDFLETHEEYNGVFHDARIEHIDNAEKVLFTKTQLYSQNFVYPTSIFPSDMIERRVILPSSSAVLRFSALDINDWKLITDNYSILWKLTCLLIKRSKFYFINEAWSTYRNHQKGISKSNHAQFHFSHIDFLKRLKSDEYYNLYPYEIHRSISREYEILLNSKNEFQVTEKKKIFHNYLWNEVFRLWFYRKQILK